MRALRLLAGLPLLLQARLVRLRCAVRPLLHPSALRRAMLHLLWRVAKLLLLRGRPSLLLLLLWASAILLLVRLRLRWRAAAVLLLLLWRWRRPTTELLLWRWAALLLVLQVLRRAAARPPGQPLCIALLHVRALPLPRSSPRWLRLRLWLLLGWAIGLLGWRHQPRLLRAADPAAGRAMEQ